MLLMFAARNIKKLHKIQLFSRNLMLLRNVKRGGSLSILLLSMQGFAADAPTPVLIGQVHMESIAPVVVASGSVKPISEQSLAFKVGGIVDKVMVKQGQSVKKGQVLASLVLEEIDANVSKAEAVLDDAKRELVRIQALSGKSMASEQRQRQAETALQVAEADLKIARFNQKYALIKAPASGRILSRDIEPNELIQAGQHAFVFADEDKGWSVRLSVSDVDVVKLAIGDTTEIHLDAYPDRHFTGEIYEISGRADPSSQTFSVDVLFTDKSAPVLYSGLIAHTRIQSSAARTLAKIPLTALIHGAGREGRLYVLTSPETHELRKVKIAYLQQGFALISEGLEQDEWFISEGGAFIVEGNPIQIQNATALSVGGVDALKTPHAVME